MIPMLNSDVVQTLCSSYNDYVTPNDHPIRLNACVAPVRK